MRWTEIYLDIVKVFKKKKCKNYKLSEQKGIETPQVINKDLE